MVKKDCYFALIIGELDALIIMFLARNFSGQLAQIPYLQGIISYIWLILPALAFLGIIIADFLARWLKVLWQLAKFLLVGTSNVFVDLGVLGALQFATGIASGYWYSVFKAISSLFSIFNSYLWNKFWSFEQKDNSEATKEAVKFFAVAGSGILVNNLIASYLVNVLGPQGGLSKQGWGIVAGVIAAIIVFIWDFVGYKFFVFKK